MNSTVRNAGIADLDAVTDLIAASYAQYEASFPQPMWQIYRRAMLDVAPVVSAGAVLVAETDGRVVGSVVFHPDGRDDRPPWPQGTAALRLLAVDPRVRGRGIGRELVAACVGRARDAGAHALGLHTAPFMPAATGLYEAMGFRRTPEHDFDAHERFGLERSPDEAAIPGLAYVLDLGRPTG